MISRLVRSADFERVLRTRSRANSAHFAVHHVIDRPLAFVKSRPIVGTQKLSTGDASRIDLPVDESRAGRSFDNSLLDVSASPEGRWLGLVVPKRHARRAVTRTLIKRQIRTAMDRHADTLAQGLWVIRLRAGFDRQRFVSAASDALKETARAELDQLLSRAARAADGGPVLRRTEPS